MLRCIASLALITVFTSSCVTSVPAPTRTAVSTSISITPQKISFKTDDGFTLGGTWYGQGSHAVILSNVGDGTQPDWQELPGELAQRGYLALTFDWRGFGTSAGKRDYTLSPIDLKAAIDFIRSQGATKIILVGASLGGMASLKNASLPELAGVIVISSPRQVPNLVISLDELKAITVPKLFIGSLQDTIVLYAETSALYQIAIEPKLLKSYAGSAHGTDILKTDDRAGFVKTITDFITTNLPN
jgi:alpha-beta hydrolase superfamily lysophospholipase